MRFGLLAASLLTALLSSACFLGGSGAQPTAAPPAPVATTAPSPVPTKPVVVASPTPPAATATATSEPELTMVWVGNTDGQGVYLRASPAMEDRVKAYADRTPLTIIDVDVDGEGMKWHHVRAPDGEEGFVPVQYTVTTEP